MAPEQVRGEEQLSGGVDLYALGCLLYQMLSGEPPFDGETIMEIFEHHLFTDVAPLPPARDDRPASLDKLIEQLLVKYPTDRPVDAKEVRTALRSILAGNEPAIEFTTAAAPAETDPAPEVQHASEEATPDADEPQLIDGGPNLTQRLVASGDRASSLWSTVVVLVGMAIMVGVILFIAGRR